MNFVEMIRGDEMTDQIAHWRGEFGDAYTVRNEVSEEVIEARERMWRRILSSIKPSCFTTDTSILEVGANIGLNIRALRRLTAARLVAVEPNAEARKRLVDDGVVERKDAHDAIVEALPLYDNSFDLVFTSGVLVHIPPEKLLTACKEIHRVSRAYIVCCEYFADRPQTMAYRGLDGILFKRDFGDFWMSNFSDLTLFDYGFFWKRATGIDNLHWWLFCKES